MVALGTAGFDPGLVYVVTVVTHGIPVIHAPKQHHIPPVRQSVIHQCRQQRAAVTQVHAPRVDG